MKFLDASLNGIETTFPSNMNRAERRATMDPKLSLAPVTSWYRVMPDKKGGFEREYNHYDEGHVGNGRDSRPLPKAGQKWPGHWFYQHRYRTREVCPKIVDYTPDDLEPSL